MKLIIIYNNEKCTRLIKEEDRNLKGRIKDLMKRIKKDYRVEIFEYDKDTSDYFTSYYCGLFKIDDNNHILILPKYNADINHMIKKIKEINKTPEIDMVIGAEETIKETINKNDYEKIIVVKDNEIEECNDKDFPYKYDIYSGIVDISKLFELYALSILKSGKWNFDIEDIGNLKWAYQEPFYFEINHKSYLWSESTENTSPDKAPLIFDISLKAGSEYRLILDAKFKKIGHPIREDRLQLLAYSYAAKCKKIGIVLPSPEDKIVISSTKVIYAEGTEKDVEEGVDYYEILLPCHDFSLKADL